jgi:spermidine synthase
VVRRGGSRELRIDGTFASFWRPGQVLTGSVWDALGAALLALPPERRRRVLLLGLGGGSAARVVRALAPRARIVGVEVEPGVVDLARRHMGLDELGVEVVVDDARRYLACGRGRFDVVLEDVFVGTDETVHKPGWMVEEGLELAAARVARAGVLASNTLDETPAVARRLRALFPRLVEVGVLDFDNRVLLAGSALPAAREIRARVAHSPALAPALDWLHFRTRVSGARRGSPGRSG